MAPDHFIVSVEEAVAANLISAQRSGLEDSPVLLDRVPDIQERLGMISNEPQELAREDRGIGTLIFVSFSLGQKEIEDLFAVNTGKRDVTLLFRGVSAGMTFAEGVRAIQALASKFDPMPNVMIDPTLFRNFDVHVVPTVARIREQSDRLQIKSDGRSRAAPKLVAKVTGS